MGGILSNSADKLFKEGRFKEALSSYKQAVKVAPPEDTITISLKILECLCKTRQYAQANDEIEKLKQSPLLLQNPIMYAEFLVLCADVNINIGNYEEARLCGEKAFKILRSTNENRLIVKVQRLLGITCLSEGNLDEARTYFEDGLSTCRRIGDEEGILDSINRLAQVSFLTGRWFSAKEYLHQGLRVSKTIRNAGWTGTLLFNLGTTYRKIGEWTLASNYLRKGIKTWKSLGDTLEVLRGELSLAFLYRIQREWKKASRLLDKCRRTSEKEGYKRELCLSYEGLGELAADMGNYTGAEEYYRAAYEIAEKIAPEGDLAVEIPRRLADLYVTLNKPEEALRHTNSALKLAKKMGDRFEEACIYRVLALIHHKMNEPEKTLHSFAYALSILEELGERHERARTLLEFGKFFRAREDTDEAIHHLLRAEELFGKLPSKYWVGVTQLEAAKVRLDREDTDSAVTILDKAQKIFDEIGEKEALKEASEVREAVESRMIERALLTVTDSSLPEGGLNDCLKHLADEIGAERVFLLLKNGKDFEIKGLYKIEKEEAEQIFTSLKSLELKNPLISTNLRLERKFLHFEKDGIFSLALLPFGSSGTRGILYIDKKNSFSQKNLVSSVRFTHSLALKIAEIRQEELKEENLRLKRGLYPEIITRNKKMIEILALVDKIKDGSAPVLVEGETGTGKELISRAIHYKGERGSRPFIPVDCGVLTETLAESTLFGHKKGAFTDAKGDKPGLFEKASSGTLFLDEVSNLSSGIQAKLLRVLEEGKVRRIGETHERKVDVRVIAASNKNLEKEVAEGRFRKDLYYRLNGIRIELPPLRERKDDIPILVSHFVDKFCRNEKRRVKGISEKTFRLLNEYSWPGNVRELEYKIKRAILLLERSDEWLTPQLLCLELKKDQAHSIIEAMKEANWVKRKAAKILGIPESTLRAKMKRLGIKVPA